MQTRWAEDNGRPRAVRRTGQEIISVSTKIGGQRAILIFFRLEEDASDTWRIGLLVGATRKAKKTARTAADWPDSYEGKSTGRSGIKFLSWALQEVNKFRQQHPYDFLVIEPTDERRNSAYRYLLRHGFQEGTYLEGPVLYAPPLSRT